MKKILVSAIVMLLAVSFANAQDVFKKGDLVINAGIGLNNSLYSGSGYKSTVPPISLSGEYGVVDNLINGENGSIGVGAYLGYTGAKWNIAVADYNLKYSSVIVGARGAFHYEFVKNLDTYAGLMLGYNVVSSKADGAGTPPVKVDGSAFASSFFLGARYWFAPGFGAFTELGYGISNFNLGISFRL